MTGAKRGKEREEESDREVFKKWKKGDEKRKRREEDCREGGEG